MFLRAIISILFFSSFSMATFNFQKGTSYYVKYDIKSKLKLYNDDNSILYTITKGSKIYVEKSENADIVFRVEKFVKPKNPDSNLNYVEKGNLYNVKLSDIENFHFRPLSGFSGGIATAPFKYRPNKGKFYPGGNLTGAGGWWYNLGGVTIKPMVFAGLTTISIADVNDENRDTETKAGFTFGIGLGINVVEKFDLGMSVGWDFVDKDWDSDKKAWFALSFGYALL